MANMWRLTIWRDWYNAWVRLIDNKTPRCYNVAFAISVDYLLKQPIFDALKPLVAQGLLGGNALISKLYLGELFFLRIRNLPHI